MKKGFLRLLAVTFLTAVFSNAYSLDAVVTSVKGNAKYKAASGTWEPITVGAKFEKGTAVQTGFKSEVTFKIGETVTKLGPVANVTIEDLKENGDKDETVLYLNAGKLKSDVKKVDKRRVGFTVRSPAATASVRGTLLDVATKYKGTNINTHRGSVKVSRTKVTDTAETISSSDETDPAGSYYVNEGQGTTISENGSYISTQQNARNNTTTLNSVPDGVSDDSSSAQDPVDYTPKSNAEIGNVKFKFPFNE